MGFLSPLIAHLPGTLILQGQSGGGTARKHRQLIPPSIRPRPVNVSERRKRALNDEEKQGFAIRLTALLNYNTQEEQRIMVKYIPPTKRDTYIAPHEFCIYDYVGSLMGGADMPGGHDNLTAPLAAVLAWQVDRGRQFNYGFNVAQEDD